VAEAVAGVEADGRHHEAILRIEVVARHVQRGLSGARLERARVGCTEGCRDDLLDHLGDAHAVVLLDQPQHRDARGLDHAQHVGVLGTQVDVDAAGGHASFGR
jgi:hypothetical protein